MFPLSIPVTTCWPKSTLTEPDVGPSTEETSGAKNFPEQESVTTASWAAASADSRTPMTVPIAILTAISPATAQRAFWHNKLASPIGNASKIRTSCCVTGDADVTPEEGYAQALDAKFGGDEASVGAAMAYLLARSSDPREYSLRAIAACDLLRQARRTAH